MTPLCIHFGACGGCSLQDLAPDAYRAGKRAMVVDALARAGVEAEVLDPVIVPPRSRRRAVFKLGKAGGVLEIGFHAARSHAIIDMRECLVLTPGLFDLAQRLRIALAPLFNEGEKAELHATETLTGFDLAFRSPRKLTPALTAGMAQAAKGLPVARIVFNNEILLENTAPEISFAGARVKLPPHAFLQSTAEGEAELQGRVLAIVGKAKAVADLFAGCGTFALPLAARARVHAVEQDAPALAALAAAARGTAGLKPVTTETRDLFKQPLTPPELKAFDAVVLDPPRAGAEAQAQALAAAKTAPRTIAYVSCDAASFARDAAILAAAGFRPGPVTPIDQFLWSSHIELVGSFVRGKE
jgi:23S rRNA (uracil1939-C5)-methyltransferase